MNREERERVLERVADEVRADSVPEIDAGRVFAALQARLDATAQREAATTRAPRRLAFVALAAAAVVLGTIGVVLNMPQAPRAEAPTRRAVEAPPAPPEASGVIDGERLGASTRLVAPERALVVNHEGRARWVLSRGSAARVRKHGPRRTVVLERGSVTASVVPSTLDESFAIEVANTRVAVHGTRFRVALVAENVEVSVQSGVVSVASRTGGPKEILRAPADGRFTLDGIPVDDGTARRTGRRAPPPPAAEASGDVSETATAASEPPATAEPVPVYPSSAPEGRVSEQDAERVEQSIEACFTRHTEAAGNLRVSATTTLSARVRPDGRISQAVFQPPLAPLVRACAEKELGLLRLTASDEGAVLERSLVLQR